MNRTFNIVGIVLLVLGNSATAQEATKLSIQKASPELANQWWQWAMASPRQSSPVSDRTGERCTNGQQGDIWFLAGGYGSSKIRRKCTVPTGKSIFFPLINMVYWPTPDGVEIFTCGRAKELAALNNDTAIDLFAEIDGQFVEDLKQYRLASQQCFDVFSRVPAAQKAYKAYPSATDGYWLQLKPLAPGRHTLKFGGRYNRNSADYGRMVQDIEYELVVE
jgi:hypothetical protein